jgi:hypothetical protein
MHLIGLPSKLTGGAAARRSSSSHRPWWSSSSRRCLPPSTGAPPLSSRQRSSSRRSPELRRLRRPPRLTSTRRASPAHAGASPAGRSKSSRRRLHWPGSTPAGIQWARRRGRRQGEGEGGARKKRGSARHRRRRGRHQGEGEEGGHRVMEVCYACECNFFCMFFFGSIRWEQPHTQTGGHEFAVHGPTQTNQIGHMDAMYIFWCQPTLFTHNVRLLRQQYCHHSGTILSRRGRWLATRLYPTSRRDVGIKFMQPTWEEALACVWSMDQGVWDGMVQICGLDGSF